LALAGTKGFSGQGKHSHPGSKEQARPQFQAAKGVPIRWHVAEKKAAEAIRELLKGEKVTGIEVVHTPALQ
jgi:hypothetical protein